MEWSGITETNVETKAVNEVRQEGIAAASAMIASMGQESGGAAAALHGAALQRRRDEERNQNELAHETIIDESAILSRTTGITTLGCCSTPKVRLRTRRRSVA